jgi:phospholipase/lecithinase/hemolysin
MQFGHARQRGSMPVMASPFLPLLALVPCAVSLADITRLGAIGDSISDEYAEENYGSYARNWTMLLVQERGTAMGPTAAGRPGGTWGEPRRTQYESNWARYGHDTTDMIASGQHTGLAAQVPSEGVSHAVIFIGTNDFSAIGFGAYFSIYNGFWSSSTTTSYVNNRIQNVQQALQAVAPTGVRLVIVNAVDFGITPLASSLYPNASRRESVSDAVAQFNAQLRALAQQHRAVYIDQYTMSRTVWGPHASFNQTLLLGNRPIALRQSDTSSGGNPLAAFVHDGVHPNTTVQGVFANLIGVAFNEGYRAGVSLFTEQEVLAHAGLAYGGSDTLMDTIGSYAQYIENYACYVNCDRSTTPPVLNVADFTCFLQQFAAGMSEANCDGSTAPPVLNVADFSCFLQKFALGCP